MGLLSAHQVDVAQGPAPAGAQGGRPHQLAGPRALEVDDPQLPRQPRPAGGVDGLGSPTGLGSGIGDGPGDGPEDGDDDQSPTMRGDDVEAYDRSRQEADVDVSYKETFDGVVYAPDVNGLVSQGWRMSGDGLSQVIIDPKGKRYQVVEESSMDGT